MRMGNRASCRRVFIDIAAKRVPTEANPKVPSMMGMHKRGKTPTISMSKKITKMGNMRASSKSMAATLPNILPKKMAPGSAGVRRSPKRQSFCFSMANARPSPISPANVVAIQKMPGAADCMMGDPGLKTKLKMSTTKNAKNAMALKRSLVRHSVLRSFSKMASVWDMKRDICVFNLGVSYELCATFPTRFS